MTKKYADIEWECWDCHHYNNLPGDIIEDHLRDYPMDTSVPDICMHCDHETEVDVD